MLLIVDDNDDLRELLEAAMTERGDSVIIARDGREAIERVESRGVRPSLILLDLHMPIMDGGAFLVASAAHPLLAHVPVVIMTSDVQPPTTLPPVVRAVLTKPVPLPTLFSLIDQIAQERRGPPTTMLANGTGATPGPAIALDATASAADPAPPIVEDPASHREPAD